MSEKPASTFERFGDIIRVTGATVALVVTVVGVIQFWSVFVANQDATARELTSVSARVEAIEDTLSKTNLDSFRIDRTEKDIGKISDKVDAIDKNVVELRVLVEKLAAGGK